MNNEQNLGLYFVDDGDGTGELFTEAFSNGFSGVDSAWFSHTNVLEFAKAIASYPLSNKNLPAISGDLFGKNNIDEVEQETLAISAYPIGSLGHLGIQNQTCNRTLERDAFGITTQCEIRNYDRL